MSHYKDMMIDDFSNCLSSAKQNSSKANKFLARGIADCKLISKSFPTEDFKQQAKEKMLSSFQAQRGKDVYYIVQTTEKGVNKNQRRYFLNLLNKHKGLLFSVVETGTNNRLHKNNVLTLQRPEVEQIKTLKKELSQKGLNIFMRKISKKKDIENLLDYLVKELTNGNGSNRVKFN